MKISFWPVFGLLFSVSAAANPLPRANPVPGGIAIIVVAEGKVPAPEVYYSDQRVLVLPNGDQWHAVVGVPLSVSPGPQFIRVKNNTGKEREIAFTVLPKDYPEQRLVIKEKRYVEPSPAELARIAREQEISKRVFTTWKNTPVTSLQFLMPAQGRLSSGFGLRRFFNNQPRQPHSGIDIAAPTGTPVIAPLPGTVAETGDFFFNGKTIFIDHGQGLISMFNHLNRILVRRGDRVEKGVTIGEIGMTGRVTGPHLHWSVSLNNSRVDPVLFLSDN